MGSLDRFSITLLDTALRRLLFAASEVNVRVAGWFSESTLQRQHKTPEVLHVLNNHLEEHIVLSVHRHPGFAPPKINHNTGVRKLVESVSMGKQHVTKPVV